MLSQLSFKLPFGKQNRWPNPQESTGVYLATIGHKKCWEAVGEARTVFGTLQIEIAEYLNQTCESLSKDVVWSLYMVGRARETASPTVTFISTEPGPRQRLKTLIKESRLLDKHPGFITMAIDRPPGCKTSVIKTLGGLEEKSSVSEAGRMEQITISVPSRTFMGTSIYLNDQVPDLVATGGGIVQSMGKSYLTSVAHPFEKYWNDRFPQATTPGDYVFDIDEINDSEEEDEAIADITSGGSVTSNSVPCDGSDRSVNSESDAWSSKKGLLESLLPLPNRNMATGLPSSLVQANTILSQRRTDNEMSTHTSQKLHSDGGRISNQVDEQSPPGLPGATRNASTPALAEDEPLIYSLSGAIISSARGGTISLDYSLFELPDSMLQKSESSPSDKSLHRSLSSAPREPRSTEIVVHTASGPVAGRLLATPSFMQPAQGMLPQQLWTVIMEGTLQSGLCGSWVMDACSGDVFGHIIAGAPEDGFAYMVPFYEILDDLNTNFGGDWTFAERPMVAQSRDHEFTISSKSQIGSQNFDTDARRGHPNAELLDSLFKSHSTQEAIVGLGDNSDTNPIENFKAWITSNSLFAAGSSGSDRSFIPQEKLQQFFNPTSKVDNLKNLLSVRGIPADIDVETIRESFVKVFSILLMINKASYIQAFILRDNLSDSSLPFGPDKERILEDEDGKSFYHEFNHAQWQFCAPVFHFHMDTRFDEQLILPLTKKEKVHDGGTTAVYKIEVHPYYNALKPGKEKQVHVDQIPSSFISCWPSKPTENTFALKTYSQGIYSKRMFENEIAAFGKLSKSATTDGSIIGYYGTYVQGETYNIIFEYADKGDLESFFQHEQPPSDAPDIAEFWKSMFSIVKALKVIHNLDPGGSDTHAPDMFSGWHQALKPSNILAITPRGNDEFCHQFKLADLGFSHFKAKDDHGGTPVTQRDVGTRSYGAPECYRPVSSSPETMPRVEQKNDVWSLGCIFSEAVTWLAHGGQGIEQYRQLRADELNRLGRGDDDCFHDGEKVLDSVQEHLKNLRDWSTRTDPLTSHILDVVDSMLLESSKRPDANSVHSKLEHVFQRWRNNFDFSRNAADLDAHTCTPPDQSFQGKAQLDTTAANSDPNGITIIDPFITEQLFQSPAYSSNRSKNAQRNLELTLPYRTSSANDAESSDDSEASNEYLCIAKTKTPDGRVSNIVISTDTGAPNNFIFRSALDRIGDFEQFPIPQRKLKAYTNPLDENRKEVPQYFILLPLYNSELGLDEVIRLKVFELSEGTNGFDIILGRKFIRSHGGHRFLAKVEEASSAEPRLASIGDNSFGALFGSKRTKEQRLLDAQEDNRFHEQNKAKSSNLYASSELGSQSPAGGTWPGTTGFSQDPTTRTAGAATWNPSAQQPNGSPFQHATRAGQQRPDRNAPLYDLQGDFASRRSNSNDSDATRFTQDTIFSSTTRRTTSSTISTCSSVPTTPTVEGKVAGRAADYSVPESCASCDVPKQNNKQIVSRVQVS